MSMVGTFDGFTAARLGLYAAQHGLRVTGNNVANINTLGYTRQRADQVSFKAGANDIYRSFYDNHVGSGALVTSISQLRDPYLDIRFRNASTDTYHYDTWLAGLQNIASILDEVGKGDNEDGLIYKAIQDLAEKLRAYSANPTELNDRLVRNSATSLTDLFHYAADRLEKLYNETVNEFNEDISAVNEILTNIRDLNKSIREAEIHGDTALEMRDERNRQIDALSQYLDIKVEYSMEDVGGGIQVEKLTIKLNNANPDDTVHTDESVLVDGVYATQLSVPEEKPVLNTYGDQYTYLKNYTYLKKIDADDPDALRQYFDENGLKLEDFLVKETAEDGTQYYIVGTNSEDAYTEEQPVLNTYDDAYLEGYQYIRKIPVDDADEDETAALQQFLEANGLEDDDLGVTILEVTSEDGNYYIIGTNSEEEATWEEQPVGNEYKDVEDSYLNEYDYIIKIPVNDTDTLEQYLADNPDVTLSAVLMSNNPYITEELEDGTTRTYFLLGTNDPDVDGIYTEPNDNFTIQLGKLLNSKGEEWKSTATSWLEVDRATVIANSTFAYTVTANFEGEDNEGFTIVDGDGEEHKYTIGTDVSLDTVQDPEEFAKFLAQEFTKLNKYPGYKIEAVGGQLIFTADPESEAYPPTALPSLSVTDVSETDWITVGNMQTIPTQTFDEHGNVIKSVNFAQVNGQWYQVTVGTEYSHEVTLDDNDLHGILQAQRELLTEEGEFSSEKDVAIDESALTKRGLPYYMKALDLLAQKFAEAYNQLNSGYAYNQDGYYIDKDGNKLVLDDLDNLDGDGYISATDGLTAGQLRNLINNGCILADDDGYAIDENGQRITDAGGDEIKVEDLLTDEGVLDLEAAREKGVYDKLVADADTWMDTNGYPMGGAMFTNLDGDSTEGITAKTISISHGWSNGVWNLVPTFMMLFSDSGGLTHSTQNDNADHMVAMIDKGLTYNPRDLYGSDAIGPELFSGSFNDMLSNMMAVQGEDASMTAVRLTTSAGIMNEVDFSRDGVSGVDLNDEAMNMITYSKAMSAAMRVMTVIDEMLDRLINNTAM